MRSVAEKKEMVAPAVYVGPQVQKRKAKATEDMTKPSIKELREITSQLKLMNDLETEPSIYKIPKVGGMSASMLGKSTLNKAEPTNEETVFDIDSKHKDPRMCSVYAAELYNNLRVTEVCF